MKLLAYFLLRFIHIHNVIEWRKYLPLSHLSLIIILSIAWDCGYDERRSRLLVYSVRIQSVESNCFISFRFISGFPSVGKSTLLCNLAGVYSEVADYEFTTLTTVPGVIRYKGAKIQLLDLPGIIEGAKDGKGRGRQVIAGILFLFKFIFYF